MPAGVVTIELVNDSDSPANVFVFRLDEDKTVQDVIEFLTPEPYMPALDRPWWSDMGRRTPAMAGETMRWEESLSAAEYVTICADSRSLGAWFGTGLAVVDG